MQIPFNDISLLHQPIRIDLDRAIQGILDSNAFINGPAVGEFEEKFAAFCGAKHCIGVGNGTDAISIALLGLGIGPGDEVITSAFGFIATTEAISATGADVVFADCDERTGNLDPDRLKDVLNERTRAIVVVHLYGFPADMPAIMAFAAEHELIVLEDSAQAHAASVGNVRIGGSGNVCTFSFYPGKNLGAIGDAGCIVCQDDDLARQFRMYANHGRETKFDHAFEGTNSRLDSLQAAVLSVKLEHLERWTEQRREASVIYSRHLSWMGGAMAGDVGDRRHVFHIYPVLVEDRKTVQDRLKQAGIGTGLHYPIPIPRLHAYEKHPDHLKPFPVADKWAAEELSLPIYPGISEAQIAYVCESLAEACKPPSKKEI